MKPGTINLHIDKIVLYGLGQLDAGQLNLAIQKELHRLIADQGLHRSLHQSRSIKRVSAQSISLTGSIRERNLGNKIAGSVYRGMKP